MTVDLSFITNQNGENLSERLKELIKDSRFFDCLVGYFYISGFHLIKDALQNTEKIRILVGLGISESVYSALNNLEDLSEKQIKEEYSDVLRREFENSPDEKDIEVGVKDFIDLIRKKD